MIAAALLVWIGLMAAAGLGATWLVLSRFPEVFFQTPDWRTSRKARVIRRFVFAGIALFGCAAAFGLALLIIHRR